MFQFWIRNAPTDHIQTGSTRQPPSLWTGNPEGHAIERRDAIEFEMVQHHRISAWNADRITRANPQFGYAISSALQKHDFEVPTGPGLKPVRQPADVRSAVANFMQLAGQAVAVHRKGVQINIAMRPGPASSKKIDRHTAK